MSSPAPEKRRRVLRRWQFTVPALFGLTAAVAIGLWAWERFVAQPRREGALRTLTERVRDSAYPEETLDEAISDVQALGLGQPAAAQLGPLLRDSNPFVRQRAAGALARLGEDAAPATAELVASLTDWDYQVRTKAAEALKNVGAEAVPLLLATFSAPGEHQAKSLAVLEDLFSSESGARLICQNAREHPERRVREKLIELLLSRWKRPESTPADNELILTTFLDVLRDDEQPEIRVWIAKVLWTHGPSGAHVWAALHEALEDTDLRVQVGAASAMRVIDERRAQVALPAVLRALRAPDGTTRMEAAQLVAFFDPERFAEAWPVIQDGLSDDDPEVRCPAVRAAQAFGAAALPAIPMLLEDAADRGCDRLVRRHVFEALATIGKATRDARIENLFREVAGDAREGCFYRQRALAGLAPFVQSSDKSLDIIVSALDDSDPEVRWMAALVLGGLGRAAERAKPALEKACQDKDACVREAATEALQKIGSR